jgi:hypothetical protein
MGFFKKIGEAFENIGEGIADKVSDAVEWGADVAGEVAEGVTRVVAGDKAADKVEKAFNDNIEPAVKRASKAVVNALNPVVHIGNVVEHGLIDGISKSVVETTQETIGATTRLIGGEKAEQKFDKFYDEKVQRWLEMGLRIVGSAALAVVPGGQLILAADVASEVGSLAYRMSQGHEANWFDALEIGGAALGAAFVGKVAGSTVQSALKNGSSRIAIESTAMAGTELALGNTVSNFQQGLTGTDLLSINKHFFAGTPTTEKQLSSDIQVRTEGDVYLSPDIYKVENGVIYYKPQET